MEHELDKCGFSIGDLLVFKGPYDHWAVYAGGDYIIHYNKISDFDIRIIEESIHDYWRRSEKRYPKKAPSLGMIEGKLYDSYYSMEIVRRAHQYVGKGDYNLFFNNCETFAKWCKYGVKMSEQAQKIGLSVSTVGGAGAGAGAGALIGAGVGSVVPIAGTAVGGLVGGVIGGLVGAVGGGGGGWAANQAIRKAKSDESDFGK